MATHIGTDFSKEQELITVKKRLDSFQFRWNPTGSGNSMPASPSTSSTTRSHTRNGSVSSSTLSASISLPSDLLQTSASNSRPSSLVGRQRPTSHHRRRSSVSTRVESADMMGVTLPELPPSMSDDNINFGDRDSIRRRALQALEGRNDFGRAGAQVEIPDFNSQGLLRKPSDREHKPSSSSPFGLSSSSSGKRDSFGLAPSSSGKRDSFGKYLSVGSSLKDQLHPLLEEEEEDEEENFEDAQEGSTDAGDLSIPVPKEGAELSPSARVSTPEPTPLPAPAKHRPSNLNLRPLSLIQSVAAASPSLPATTLPSLRHFSLSTQSDKPSGQSNDTARGELPSSYSVTVASRRGSMNGDSTSAVMSPKRNSSISYIRSGASPSPPTQFTLAGLPTPGATPTSERRESASSLASFASSSKRNASEDIFLQQSHATLLSRVAELERALQIRSHSRPASVQSAASSKSDESEEGGSSLVAQLKSEREELNRDIEGWRQRVRDLEQSKAALAHDKVVLERRLNAEKHEAWLKTDKLGILEMEMKDLTRQLRLKEEAYSNISRKLDSTQTQLSEALLECNSLREDAEVMKRQLAEAQTLTRQLMESRKVLQDDLAFAREALASEQSYRTQLTTQLDAIGVLQTPRVPDHIPSKGAARSIDSLSTTVDAEESLKAPFTLKAVEEESSIYDAEDDDENELASYEDDDDMDYGNPSPIRSSSSFGSDDDFPRSLSHLRISANGTPVASSVCGSQASTPSPTSSPCPTPLPPLVAEVTEVRHEKNASLSKTWTFPRGGGMNAPPAVEEVDHFFGCLEDVNDSPVQRSGMPIDNRDMFRQRLQFCTSDDDSFPPFMFPAQKTPPDGTLASVAEEDEFDEKEDCDTPDGKTLSFPVSVSEDSLCDTKLPVFEDESPSESVPFVFPQMKKAVSTPSPRLTSAKSSRDSAPASMIPVCRTVSTQASPAAGVRTTTLLSSLPSRIPPPSPPTFIAKPPARMPTTPSPPKRKPAPSLLSPLKTTPIQFTRNPNLSTRGIGQSSPQSGSTFIPQLKVLNVNVSPYRSEPKGTLLGIKSRAAQQHGAQPPSSSSHALFHTVSSFLPLPSFSSWMSKKEPARVAPTLRPVFVSKEKQLLRLRASLPSTRTVHEGSLDVCGCRQCRGDLISL